jgi:arsenate reductase
MITIYHNSRCQKSRTALSYLENIDNEISVIDYLKVPPSQKELKHILELLGIKAFDLVRKKEELYKNQFSDKQYTETQWIKILSENPILIERPIIIKDKIAVIGRDEISLNKII